MMKPLQDMIKKNVEFKWGPKEKESFTRIREEIEKSPSLLSLDFNKDFILYTFASNIEFALVITHKNDEGNDFPIAFMSSRASRRRTQLPLKLKNKLMQFSKKLSTLGHTC
jgi:hypothetical protein